MSLLSYGLVVDAFSLSAAWVREQGGHYRSSVFPRLHQPALQQLGEGPGEGTAVTSRFTVVAEVQYNWLLWRHP